MPIYLLSYVFVGQHRCEIELHLMGQWELLKKLCQWIQVNVLNKLTIYIECDCSTLNYGQPVMLTGSLLC